MITHKDCILAIFLICDILNIRSVGVIMEKYYEKQSLRSKMIEAGLKLINTKSYYSDIEKMKKIVEKNSTMDYSLSNKYKMVVNKGYDIPVYTYNGTIASPKNKILVYIHGGSYVQQAYSLQITFAIRLSQMTNSTLIMPIYTLAPKGDFEKLYKDMDKIYYELMLTNKEINFLGDSAGGGFSISYSMYLRDKGLKVPKNLLLVSPWVDISLSNPKLKIYEKKENFIAIKGNKFCYELWANSENNLKSWKVSPLYGNFENLGKMSISVGGNELIKPDISLLVEKLKEKNINYNYFECSNQSHNCAIYPTKERSEILKEYSK